MIFKLYSVLKNDQRWTIKWTCSILYCHSHFIYTYKIIFQFFFFYLLLIYRARTQNYYMHWALYFSITITNILLLLLKSVNRENKSIPWWHNAYIPLGFHELNSLSIKWNGIEYSKTYVYFVSWIWLTKILSICFACVTMHVCFVAVSLGIVIHLNLRIHFWFVSISLINWSNMLYSKQFDLRTICGNYSTQHEHNTIRNQCSAFDFSFSWNAKLTLHQLNGICLARFSWLNDIGGMTRKKVFIQKFDDYAKTNVAWAELRVSSYLFFQWAVEELKLF